MAALTFADLRKAKMEVVSYLEQEVAELKKHRVTIEAERKKTTKKIAQRQRKIKAWKKAVEWIGA